MVEDIEKHATHTAPTAPKINLTPHRRLERDGSREQQVFVKTFGIGKLKDKQCALNW